MTADFAYKLVLYCANKTNGQGNITPEEFDVIINQGQDDWANWLIGELQQYQYGRPQARIAFGQNQVVRQRLTPIIYGYTLSIDTTGFSPYPADFEQEDAMWSLYGYKRIKSVQQQYLASYYNSVINPIATNPIHLVEERGFRFIPYNPYGYPQAQLSYIKTPPRIHWAYTEDSNGLPVYDAANSIGLVWSALDCIQVVVRALRLVGVNLQEQIVNQYAEQVKAQGG